MVALDFQVGAHSSPKNQWRRVWFYPSSFRKRIQNFISLPRNIPWNMRLSCESNEKLPLAAMVVSPPKKTPSIKKRRIFTTHSPLDPHPLHLAKWQHPRQRKANVEGFGTPVVFCCFGSKCVKHIISRHQFDRMSHVSIMEKRFLKLELDYFVTWSIIHSIHIPDY